MTNPRDWVSTLCLVAQANTRHMKLAGPEGSCHSPGVNHSFSSKWIPCMLPLAALAAGYWIGHAPPAPAAAPRIRALASATEKPAGLPESAHDQLRLAEGRALRAQLLALLPTASAADCARIAVWLPLTKWDEWDLLLLRWSETNPQAMSLWVLDHPPLSTRLAAEKCQALFLSRGLWEPVLKTDPAAALDHWYAHGCPVRLHPDSAAFRRMGHAAFLAWVDSHPAMNRKLAKSWKTDAWKDWAAFNAKAAFAFARTQKPDALGELLPELAISDPAQAMDLLESLPPDQAGTAVAAKVLGQLARKDVDAAIAAVLRRFPGEQDQQVAAAELFRALADDGNPAALRVLSELPWKTSAVTGDFSDSPVRMLFKLWAASEPEAAYAALSSLPERLDGLNLGRDVFNVWARKDAAGSLAAASRLSAGDAAKRRELRDAVFYSLGNWTPNEEVALLRHSDAAELQADVEATQDGMVNDCSTLEFLAFSLKLPAKIAAARFMDSSLDFAPLTPSAAAQLEQAAPADWQPVLAAIRLWTSVRMQGDQAPEVAAQLTQMASELRPEWAGRILRDTAYQFVVVDKESAAAWVESWPAGLRTDATLGLVSGLLEPDPAESFAWAVTVQPTNDDQRRELQDALETSLRNLAKADPAAAAAAIEESSLPEALKSTLRQSLTANP